MHMYFHIDVNYAAMDTHSNFTMMTAKDKHQSDSEERHTRELHNDIAVPRLYLSTLYIVDRYMYM